FARGLILFDAELIKQALTFFDKSSDLREHADVRYAMGLVHLKQEDLVAAEYSFARAIELEPDHVPALHNLAVVYEQTDRPHMATPLLNQVVQLTPHLATIDAARNVTYDETVLME
ncbi:MAG: tetratricopeptide repeat protein, partial [Candidatus Latescibacterota bacterium]|nr:tetratricopeptide repeat protein [Candidatus Latescibacterota bacterium]